VNGTDARRLDETKQTVRGLLNALNERRLDDLWNFLDPKVVDHNKIIFGEADEPGAAFDGFRQQLDAFGRLELDPQELMGEDNLVAVRLLVRGTHTGRHPRMPEPTGRDFEVEQIWIFTVVEGKVSEIRAVSDRLGMFIQLGWDWPDRE
jgi:predicted ester cyclase